MTLFCLYFMLTILPSPAFVAATASDPDAQVALAEQERQLCADAPVTTEPTYGAQDAF